MEAMKWCVRLSSGGRDGAQWERAKCMAKYIYQSEVDTFWFSKLDAWPDAVPCCGVGRDPERRSEHAGRFSFDDLHYAMVPDRSAS